MSQKQNMALKSNRIRPAFIFLDRRLQAITGFPQLAFGLRNNAVLHLVGAAECFLSGEHRPLVIK